MKANRRRDTTPEVRVRSALHRAGLRFRKDLLVRFRGGHTRPDVVFTSTRVAVYVDGCFWHSCPRHGTRPRNNSWYWRPKLRRNLARDRRVTRRLRAEGWLVLRRWEHELPSAVAAAVVSAIRARSRSDWNLMRRAPRDR